MKYAVLALLLTLQTAAPVPRKATNNSTASRQNIQKNAVANQQPTTVTGDAKAAPTNQESRNNPPNSNEHVTVIVQQPTSVSGWEKAYVIFTGLLVAIGAAGVCYAIKTLNRVETQAGIMQGQLTKMGEQIKIQSAAMEQWIDVEPVGVERKDDPLNNSVEIAVKFDAVNNTSFVLTIEKIVTKISIHANTWQVSTVSSVIILPPSRVGKPSMYPFYAAVKITEKEAEWFNKGTVLTVNGEVTFKDCLQATRVQWFSGLYACGTDSGNLKYMKPMGIVPDHKTEHGEY